MIGLVSVRLCTLDIKSVMKMMGTIPGKTLFLFATTMVNISIRALVGTKKRAR